MKITISTQYRENYGSHDWNGEGECPQYWKCKGGSVYILPGLSQVQAEEILEKNIQEFVSLISYSNDYSEEFILSYDIHGDADQVCDDWDSPVEIYNENGSWVARCVTKNDEYGFMNKNILEKQESYNMLPEGKRENHKVSYLVTPGNLISSSEIGAFLQN